jgi:hypothetical protein
MARYWKFGMSFGIGLIVMILQGDLRQKLGGWL